MGNDDGRHPTTSPTPHATDRAARLRGRVLAALREGDPDGSWRRVSELLDRAERARQLAEEQLEIGEALRDETRR